MLFTAILALFVCIAFGQATTSSSTITEIDAFKISNLASNYVPTRGETEGFRRLQFDFIDLSTSIQQNTSCQVVLSLSYTGSNTDVSCESYYLPSLNNRVYG